MAPERRGPNPLEARRAATRDRVGITMVENLGELSPTMGFAVEGVATAHAATTIGELRELITLELESHDRVGSSVGRSIMSNSTYRLPTGRQFLRANREQKATMNKEAHTIMNGRSTRQSLQQLRTTMATTGETPSMTLGYYQDSAAKHMAQLRFALSVDTGDPEVSVEAFKGNFNGTTRDIATDVTQVFYNIRAAEAEEAALRAEAAAQEAALVAESTARIEAAREDLGGTTGSMLYKIAADLGEVTEADIAAEHEPAAEVEVYTRKNLPSHPQAAADEITRLLAMDPEDFVREAAEQRDQENPS